MKQLKKHLALGLGLATTLGFLVLMTQEVSASSIHTHRSSETLAHGVTYTHERWITRAGLVDVHVIAVELESEALFLAPVSAPHGGRGSTTSLLNGSGALAGINGDFFNMGSLPSTPLGQVVEEGVPRHINQGNGRFATFALDTYYMPFIQYLEPRLRFHYGATSMSIRGLNQIQANMQFPMAIDRTVGYTNARFLERNADLTTVVVDGGYITAISEAGEDVRIPRYGYLILLAEGQLRDNIEVGQPAYIDINFGVDATIWQAISGAGMILENGRLSNSGYVAGGNARHPRSAVGVSQNGQVVYLVAVDGRGTSIGATHSEMATIMQSLGAHTAMHLDGGGSTTLGMRENGAQSNRVVNSIPGGSQRQVANALGVFNQALVDQIATLELRTTAAHMFVGEQMSVHAGGLNGHLYPVSFREAVSLTFYPDVPREGQVLMPEEVGLIEITLAYGELITQHQVEVVEAVAISSNREAIDLTTGARDNLRFYGQDARGRRAGLRNIEVSVIPETAGVWENGVFTAGATAGVVRAVHGELVRYIPVMVNGEGPGFADQSSPLPNPYRLMQGGAGQRLTLERTNGYSFRGAYGGTVISLSAREGSLTETSIYNWSFVNEVRHFDSQFVVFLLDRPVNRLPQWERQAMTEAFEAMVLAGRQVFVVSGYGMTQATSYMAEGVTYIYLPEAINGANAFDQVQFYAREGRVGFYLR